MATAAVLSSALWLAETAADKVSRIPRRLRDIDPTTTLMRAARRFDQALHAISLQHARRRGAAALACVEKSPHQSLRRSDARIDRLRLVRIVKRDGLQGVVGSAPKHELEAAKIIGSGIGQHKRAILTIEFDAVTRAEERGAADLQAAACARGKGERQCNTAVPAPSRQRKNPGTETRDGAAKPFEIMKAM